MSDFNCQLYFALGHTGPQIWTVWFVLFVFEMLVIMSVSSYTPGIGFQHTHLNVRMALLTLIIIGEAAVSVTRIVNKVVAGGGWTLRSFAHILGVTTTVVRFAGIYGLV
jgi:low temperature requirement protein LtrA